MEKDFCFKNTVLNYSVYGTGPKILLAFHGFGQNKSAYKPFQSALGDDYTIYSFDLFFHGKSKWNNDLPVLSKDFWKELMKAFLIQEKIGRFSIVGYSLGGKFLLATLESFPQNIEKIIFIAPDGIKINFWYNLATYPYLLRLLFKKTINTPQIFQGVTRLADDLGLVNKSLLKFAKTQMDTREKREKVYSSWVVFRGFKFDNSKIASLINDHEIAVEVFLGRYDKMIKRKHVNLLLKKLNDYKLEVLETGHNKLIAEVAEHLKKEKND